MSKRRSKLGISRGERYALLPEELIESDAYHALPDWARSVLVALACRYNGANNGNLSLTMSDARRLGVPAQWKLYAGLRVLELADLIQCTRRGRLEKGTKLCSLYALTWRGIDPCEGIEFDAGIKPIPIPSHAWAKWTRPDDWADVLKAINRKNRGRKNPVTIRDGQGRITRDGAVNGKTASHVMDKGRRFIAPPMMDTSKNSPQGAAKVRKAMAQFPLLGDSDIARISGTTPEFVWQVRQRA
jgi:hypothetical protein